MDALRAAVGLPAPLLWCTERASSLRRGRHALICRFIFKAVPFNYTEDYKYLDRLLDVYFAF